MSRRCTRKGSHRKRRLQNIRGPSLGKGQPIAPYLVKIEAMDQEEARENQQEQLNAVLDAALDALDSEDDEELEPAKKAVEESDTFQDERKPSKPKPVYGPEKPSEFDMASFDDVMKHMFSDAEAGGDPEAALDSFMKQLQSQLASEFEKVEESQSMYSSTEKSSKSTPAEQVTPSAEASSDDDNNNVDRTISKLLNGMATANNDNDNGGDIPEGGEEAILRDMMTEFENMAGGGFDQDALVDGMMQQLLSKDIMYEPMKQVTERFPSWLEENKSRLSEEEYQNRSQQYKCFQKLIYVYESEPENVKKLMELMQDVQEYGQPPAEIIKEIAPGLDLDEEGVPKLDGMGGFPFAGENEECSIM